MSLTEKYPNLTGDESPQQIVKEVLSTVGIVNDAKVTGAIVDLIDEVYAPLKSHLDSMRAEILRLTEENGKLTSELATFKPAPPAPTITESPAQIGSTEQPPASAATQG